MRFSTFGLVIGAAVALLATQSATQLAKQVNAQSQSGRYAPSRPTVSPYLNLLRRDAGPVTNYYTLVRPQQQQQAFNQQQQAFNRQQQSLLQTQQQGLRNVQEGLLEIRQPQASPTGTGGGFMNYSHFYTFQRAAPTRR